MRALLDSFTAGTGLGGVMGLRGALWGAVTVIAGEGCSIPTGGRGWVDVVEALVARGASLCLLATGRSSLETLVRSLFTPTLFSRGEGVARGVAV